MMTQRDFKKVPTTNAVDPLWRNPKKQSQNMAVEVGKKKPLAMHVEGGVDNASKLARNSSTSTNVAKKRKLDFTKIVDNTLGAEDL